MAAGIVPAVSSQVSVFTNIPFSAVELSMDAGNLIQERADGLYYGITAPANVANIYIDSINGLDTNPGTMALPLQTLLAAVNMGPPGITRNLWLYEQQTFDVDPANPAVMRGGSWYIAPYGPQTSALPPVVNAPISLQAGAIPLSPTIHSLPMISVPVSGGVSVQYSQAFYPINNAYVNYIGIILECAAPNGSSDTISGDDSAFTEASGGGQFYLQNCIISFPDPASRLISSTRFVGVSLELYAFSFIGSGMITSNLDKLFSLQYIAGSIGSNDATSDIVISYLGGPVASNVLFSNFNTNLVPNVASDNIAGVTNLYAPMAAYNWIAGNNNTITATVTFVAPDAGMLFAVGGRNNSGESTAAHTGTLYINAAQIMTDNTYQSIAHSGSTFLSAGATVSADYTTSSDVSFSAYISLMWVPVL